MGGGQGELARTGLRRRFIEGVDREFWEGVSYSFCLITFVSHVYVHWGGIRACLGLGGSPGR
jgi:hypothetical protein